jgi:hypothetical protein
MVLLLCFFYVFIVFFGGNPVKFYTKVYITSCQVSLKYRPHFARNSSRIDLGSRKWLILREK